MNPNLCETNHAQAWVSCSSMNECISSYMHGEPLCSHDHSCDYFSKSSTVQIYILHPCAVDDLDQVGRDVVYTTTPTLYQGTGQGTCPDTVAMVRVSAATSLGLTHATRLGRLHEPRPTQATPLNADSDWRDPARRCPSFSWVRPIPQTPRLHTSR